MLDKFYISWIIKHLPTHTTEFLQITEIQNYSHFLKVIYVRNKRIYQCRQIIKKFIEISRLQSSVANGCKER